MSQSIQISLARTIASPCSYLNQQQTSLLVQASDQEKQKYYPQLIEKGFRRSGREIYRPDCQHCDACQSLRVSALEFKFSRSQRLTLKRNQTFRVEISRKFEASDYSLFEKYINQQHADGEMYPTSQAKFIDFLGPSWQEQIYFRCFDGQKLIAVAISDLLPDGLSAVYTHYDPDYARYSLGKFCILKQIEWLQQRQLSWLYLGYQIDDCQKMSYKRNFTPNQRYIRGLWDKQ